jgi:hypothetical protein
MEYRRDIMLNQISLPRTQTAGGLFDAAAVVATLRRRFLASGMLRLRTRRSVSAGRESYFEDGLMKRELHRL